MEKPNEFHRTKTVQAGDELIIVGYRWVTDTEPFVGGHLKEEEVVIERRLALRVVHEQH